MHDEDMDEEFNVTGVDTVDDEALEMIAGHSDFERLKEQDKRYINWYVHEMNQKESKAWRTKILQAPSNVDLDENKKRKAS